MSFRDQTNQLIENFVLFPCEMPEVFVQDLKEGEQLISYDPFIIFNQNGLAVGFNESFTQFYHLDVLGRTRSILNINWTVECKTKTLIQIKDDQIIKEMPFTLSLTLSFLFMIGLGGFYYVFKR